MKNKGITLIALVITIVIMLILAAVSISALSDNGLFEKAKLSKQKQTEAEVREKISLLVSEYAIEREEGKTLSDFLIVKKDSGEIDDFVDNGDGTFDIIINGYITTMTENDLSTTEPVILSDIIVTYSAKAFVDNKIQAVITAKSQSVGIKEIRLLNNVTVQGNNKNSVAFDHIIEANTEYQIEVELTDGTTSTKTIKYEDTEAPTATIELLKKVIFKKGKIQAKISIEDNRSGINISNCKWVAVQSSENLGTEDESLYTGTFTKLSETIETEEITEPGDYYIHLLLKDNIGNVTEVISEKIEIKDGYAISTPDDLQAMGTDLTGKYYVVNDIDMTGFEFQKIGGIFTGTIDGQGYTISNLTMSFEKTINMGMFQDLNNATIKNILFKNLDFSGGNNGGVFAYRSYGTTNFIKVGMTGSITGYTSSSDDVGSFVGKLFGGSINFENCYSRMNIKQSSKYDSGGFVGTYSKGTFYTNKCYWSGTNPTSYRVGVFIGTTSTSNKSVEDCFYNKDLFTPLSTLISISGTGLTTEEFSNSDNFTNWDFTNDWYIDTETGYPELKF